MNCTSGLLVLSLLAAPLAAPAQVLGGSEPAAGAALNLALRGPWVAPAWRRPLPRLVVSQAISVGYELAVDPRGWARGRDVAPRLGGYLLTEGLVALGKKLLR